MPGSDAELRLKLLADDQTGRATKSAADNLDDVATAADKAGTSTEKLGATSDKTGGRLSKLDHEIGLVEHELRGLHESFADTNDAAERMDLSKVIRSMEGDLRKLNKSKTGLLAGLLPTPAEAVKAGAGVGKAVAESTSSGLMDGLKAVKGAAVPVLAGVAIGAAPVIGATIAAAVIGGAGVGGVVGGIMLARSDKRVAVASVALGDVIYADAQSRAKSKFVEPTLAAIGEIQRGYAGMGADIDRIFANSSKFVAPLTRGVIDFTQQVTNGLADLTDGAGPVIDVLSTGIARTGDALGDIFSDLKDNGVDAAVALEGVFNIVEGTIRFTGAAVNALTEAFGTLAKYGAFGQEAQQEYIRLTLNAQAAANAGKDVAASLGTVTGAGAATATAIGGLVSKLYDLDAENRSLYGSTTSAAQAIADMEKALEENGATLDLNTQQGRNNRRAVENLATALNAQLEATRTVNGEGPQTDAVAAQNRASFIRLATQMTGSSTKAVELANSLLGIPNVTRAVKVTGVAAAMDTLRRLQAEANSYARVWTATMVTNYVMTGKPSSDLNWNGYQGRETGGPVRAGKAYVVGEKRAEVFVPDQDGKIIPSVDQFTRAGAASSYGSGWMSRAVPGGQDREMRLVASGGADGAVAQMINYLIRNGMLNVVPA